MKVSVAVPAFNEERNIGFLIDSLRAQHTRRAEIVEIVVVASGCTDRTADVVLERAQRRGTRVRLIVEPERRGKVAAINTYLQHGDPHVEAVCLCSADLLVAPDAIERLVQCLLINHDVGMCGARPMPTNGYNTFLGEAAHFLWHMHHKVALEKPKLGEMVMLRSGIVKRLPTESAVDEATLESRVIAAGYVLSYVPEAVVHNHAPRTLREFVRQRRRIAAGHYWLRDVSGYTVSTMDLGRTARLTLSELSFQKPRRTLYALGTIGIEAISRGLGWYDFRTRRDHSMWKVSVTTKSVMTGELQQLWGRERELAGAGALPFTPAAGRERPRAVVGARSSR
jgi:cellulose synthase/poly-beta-1,6-N-acetylglucosamine synthase-like glycosyltransferase